MASEETATQAELPDTSYMSLLAASNIIGVECTQPNKAFVNCKLQDENPAKCVAEGEKVTACVLKVLRVSESQCGEKFASYKKCLKAKDRSLDICRNYQLEYESCWKETS